jgi:hypothetical protein
MWLPFADSQSRKARIEKQLICLDEISIIFMVGTPLYSPLALVQKASDETSAWAKKE